MSLFRKEVKDNLRDRLYGEVLVENSPKLQVFTFILLSCSCLIGLILLSIKYPKTEQVQGVVVSSVAPIRIIAPYAGTINKINVKVGEEIKAGTTVAVIRRDLSTVDGNFIANNSRLELKNQISNAEGEFKRASEQSAAERKLLINQKRAQEDERSNLHLALNTQTKLIESLAKTSANFRDAVAEGVASKLESEIRHRDYIAAVQRFHQLKQEFEHLKTQLISIDTQLLKNAHETNRAENEYRNKLSNLRQQALKNDVDEEYNLVANVSGRISSLQLTQGKWTDGRQPLAVLMPDLRVFEAEMYVPANAIGFVKKGEEVRIMMDTFQYQTYGTINATISYVSNAIERPDEIDTSIKLESPVFRVRAALREQKKFADGEWRDLQHGMTFRAQITVMRRSFWDWLFAPLNAITKTLAA